MLRIFSVLIITLFTAVSFASTGFTGNWSGEGKYVYDGEMTDCSLFELSFFSGQGRFQFIKGQRQCDKLNESYPPVALTARDGKFYFNNQEVGSYTQDIVHLNFRQPEGNGKFRNWRMSMRVSGDHLMYEESRTMEGEDTPLISFAGILFRR